MSDQPNVAEFVSKRIERFNAFERLCKVMAEDLKEMKYQVTQYEAKVQTYEKQILAKKSEIVDLDEKIRQRKIEAVGSLNNIAGDLNRREIELVKAKAELHVREENVKARAAEAESLIVKAEKVISRQTTVVAPIVEPVSLPVIALEPVIEATTPSVIVATEVKRGRGRPKKEAMVSA